MPSFGYKNRYYTTAKPKLGRSKDWVEKQSKKIKIKNVRRSQRRVKTKM